MAKQLLTETDGDEDKGEIEIVEGEKPVDKAQDPPKDEKVEDPPKGDDDADDDDDERLSADERAEERSPNWEKNRANRQKRKLLTKLRREREERELAELRQTVAVLQQAVAGTVQRVSKQEADNLEERLAQARHDVQVATQAMSAAVAENRAADIAEALEVRDAARDILARLEQAKAAAVRQPARQPQAPAVPPALKDHAQKWMSSNPWFNPRGGDARSNVVLAIDRNLSAEGYDPTSEDYWKEMTRRASKRLPDLFAGDEEGDEPAPRQEQRRSSGGPPVSGGRETVSQSGKKTIYVDAQMKAALDEAGITDPKRIARIVQERQRILKDNERAR